MLSRHPEAEPRRIKTEPARPRHLLLRPSVRPPCCDVIDRPDQWNTSMTSADLLSLLGARAQARKAGGHLALTRAVEICFL